MDRGHIHYQIKPLAGRYVYICERERWSHEWWRRKRGNTSYHAEDVQVSASPAASCWLWVQTYAAADKESLGKSQPPISSPRLSVSSIIIYYYKSCATAITKAPAPAPAPCQTDDRPTPTSRWVTREANSFKLYTPLHNYWILIDN